MRTAAWLFAAACTVCLAALSYAPGARADVSTMTIGHNFAGYAAVTSSGGTKVLIAAGAYDSFSDLTTTVDVGTCGAPANGGSPPLQWSASSHSFSPARYFIASATVGGNTTSPGTQALFAGGVLYGSSSGVSTVDIYTAATDTWSTTTLPGGARYYMAAAATNDGRPVAVFAGGSADGSTAKTAVDVYNGTSFFSARALPVARYRISAASGTGAAGHLVILVGGQLSGPQYAFSSAINVYDTVANAWFDTVFPGTVRHSALVACVGSTAYIIGGADGSNSELLSMFTFDLLTHAFSAEVSIPYKNYGGQVVVTHNPRPRLYLTDPNVDYIVTPTAVVSVYDVQSRTWTVGRPAISRYSYAGFVVPNAAGDVALFAGGCCATPTVEYFNAAHPCADFPCGTHGVCQSAPSNGTRDGLPWSLPYTCVCYEAYSGPRCTDAPYSLPLPASQLSAASTGVYAVFVGGAGASYYGAPGPAYAQILNTQTGVWTSQQTTATGTGQAVCAVPGTDMIVIAGGTSPPQNTPTKAVDVFHGATGLVTRNAGQLQVARVMAAAAATSRVALVAGGITVPFSGEWLAVVDVYTVATNAWTVGAHNLSVARQFQPNEACSALDRYIVFGPGSARYDNTVNAVDIYDTVTDVWRSGVVPTKRVLYAVASAGERVFFAGGLTEISGGGVYGVLSVDVLNVTAGVGPGNWTTISAPRVYYGLTALFNGNKLYFAGRYGQKGTGTLTNSAERVVDILDPHTLQWTNTTLVLARGNVAGTVVDTGSAAGPQLYIAGGQTDTGNNVITGVVDRLMCENVPSVCTAPGATCTNTPLTASGGGGYVCSACPTGYGGDACANCASNPCLHGATACADTPTGPVCNCTAQWTGQFCATAVVHSSSAGPSSSAAPSSSAGPSSTAAARTGSSAAASSTAAGASGSTAGSGGGTAGVGSTGGSTGGSGSATGDDSVSTGATGINAASAVAPSLFRAVVTAALSGAACALLMALSGR